MRITLLAQYVQYMQYRYDNNKMIKLMFNKVITIHKSRLRKNDKDYNLL